jgi:hypothetical protein
VLKFKCKTVVPKGLIYNLHIKKKDWLKNLALEAENALNFVHNKHQDFLKKSDGKEYRNIV